MRGTPLSTPLYSNPYNSTNMDPIKAAIAGIKSLPHDQSFTFSAIARKHGVVRSTLIRRHRVETQPRIVKAISQQALTPMQEQELVRWINRMNDRLIPPLGRLVRNWTSTIAKKEVGKKWVYGFLDRHEDELVYKWTTPMDRDHHKADSGVK